MGNKKPNRKRKYPCQFYVDEEELAFIKYKMTKAGIKNQSEYLRQMAVYGKVVNLDFSDLRPIYNEINKIGVNLNQIARIAMFIANIAIYFMTEIWYKNSVERWNLYDFK